MSLGAHDVGRPALVGRATELELLAGLLDPAGPELALVTGLPGVGKSSLVRALAVRAAEVGVELRRVDCRTVEPTRAAFEAALGEGVPPGVLCLDHYDHFLLLDTWLRTEFLEHAVGRTRLVLVGRSAPGDAWLTTGRRAARLELTPLTPDACRELLAARGLEPERAAAVQRLTRGHPFAIELALAAPGGLDSTGATGDPVDGGADVVRRLTRYFLENVEDAGLRRALEACSTVRRVTAPVLDALLADAPARPTYDELVEHPLVESRGDGAALHPAVHDHVAAWLRSADPARFVGHRRAAWAALERAGACAAPGDLWRYTADSVYLVDDPIVRGAFFPEGAAAHRVEAFTPADLEPVLDLVERHDGPEERALLAAWAEAVPGAFRVARRGAGGAGDVDGFYVMLDPALVPAARLEADPLTRAWLARVPADERATPRRSYLLRRWLAADEGEAPSAVQAACWLDVKRAYLEGRPTLGRVFLAVKDLAPYGPAAVKLGFQPIEDAHPRGFLSAVLEFGPGSVDAWLRRLVRSSLGIADVDHLDRDRHGLVLGGELLPLTPRELAVVAVLLEEPDRVVDRDTLLERAWDGGLSVGSNVVDVLVRGLRKKLGPAAERLETVRGVGYRWRP